MCDNKVVRDGMVAVLVSGGYGAGWSSWGAPMYEPEIVAWVQDGKPGGGNWMEAWKKDNERDFYCGGVVGLYIEWIPEGTRFRVSEYDGNESIEIHHMDSWNEA
jgi:hypothetical protein